jgi:hypothetical protein
MGASATKIETGSAKERVRKHREALRANGLRPITRWVPDTRNAEFIAEYRRQRQAIADRAKANPQAEAEYWQWAESVQTDEGWV